MDTSTWAPHPQPRSPEHPPTAPTGWAPPPPPPAGYGTDPTSSQSPSPPWGATDTGWHRTDPGVPPAGPPPPPPGGTPPPHRSRGWGRAAALGAILVLSAGSFVAGRALHDDAPTDAVTSATGVATTPVLPGTSGDDEPVADVAAALSPAVVQIETGSGLGSGFVYDADQGLIMTAAHVVDGATDVTLRLADGRTADGTVVGADDGSDVAVVRTDADGLTAASLALDDDPEVGQLAVAIGSPFGLDQTVTSGIVSAVGRTVETPGGAVAMVQTDAPINPGNSGGALADRQGRVIGVNDSIASESGGNVGVGFAVPIGTAKQIADQLVAGQPIANGYLGVSAGDVTDGSTEGAQVVQVEPGGPGDDAGLRTGDVITAVDDGSITASADLVAAIRSHAPGDEVQLTVVRQGDESQVSVTLGEAPTR